ncbi:hypothetical protein RS030_6865 [Cryptosporidium xiaoi]|uniref:Uncharacterized protein n=1 Tax=Cryptosporidium xiaoi TaxID=659607 RepID=A0AAV9Y0X0_9CRYT
MRKMKGVLLVFIFTLLSFGTSNENSFFSAEPYSLLRIRSDDKSDSNLGSGATVVSTPPPPPPPPLPPIPNVSSKPNNRQQLILTISITKVEKFLQLLEKLKNNYQACLELVEWLFEVLKNIIKCLKECINDIEQCKPCLESIKKKLEIRRNEEVEKGTEGICIDLIDEVLKFLTNIMEFKMSPLTIPSTTTPIITSTSTSAPTSTAE